MFSYDSKNAEVAWPAGNYPAIFKGAIDGVSKSTGKEMQTWTFEVYDDKNDRKQIVTEYVTEAALFKVRQLASALNRAQEFKDNCFYPEDHAGAAVMVELKIEQQDGYDDRNRINRISARPPASSNKNAAQAPIRRQTAAQKMLDENTVTVPDGLESLPIKDSDIPF